jgi:hypothetical protein
VKYLNITKKILKIKKRKIRIDKKKCQRKETNFQNNYVIRKDFVQYYS